MADVACRADNGTGEVVALTVQEVYSDRGTHHAGRILVVGPDSQPRPLWEGEATGGTFSPDGRTAWLTAGRDGRSLVQIDLGDPAHTVVQPLTELPAGMGPLALSSGGRHLAGATSHRSWTGAGTPPPTTAVVVDLAASPPKVAETELGPYGRYNAALWAGPDRIVFAPSWNDQPVQVFDTALTDMGSWPGWAASHATLVGGHLVGLNGPKVITAPVATGPTTPWADLESGVPGTITAFPNGTPIGESAPTTTTTAPPAPAPQQGEQAVASLPDENGGGTGGRPLLAGGTGAALLGAAAASLIRRRRTLKLPPL